MTSKRAVSLTGLILSFKLLKVRVSGWEIQLSNKKMEYNFTLFMIFRRLNVLLLENEFESHNDIDTASYLTVADHQQHIL